MPLRGAAAQKLTVSVRALADCACGLCHVAYTCLRMATSRVGGGYAGLAAHLVDRDPLSGWTIAGAGNPPDAEHQCEKERMVLAATWKSVERRSCQKSRGHRGIGDDGTT